MKIKILIAVLFLYGVSAYGQNRYAYLPEGKVSFKVANHEIFIGYKNKLLKDNIFVIKELLKNKTNLTTDLGAGTQKITLDKTINQDTISSLILKLRNDTNILYANPFLIYKNGVRQGIDNKIILRPKDAQVINNLKKLFPKLGIVTIEKRPFITNEYLITIANKKLDALDAANTLYESNLFEYCEPNFIILGVFSTTDPLFAYQWALENTGSAIQYDGLVDADMDVTEAWLYNTGSTNIKIAVLDQGVELNHEDLINNLLPGYDALGLGSNGGNGVDSFHGTILDV